MSDKIPSLDERLKLYQPFWTNWKLDEFISRGNFGAVYKLHDPIFDEYSVLKVITIDRSNIGGIRSSTQSNAMQAMRERTGNEILLMNKLKHCPYIVHCNNYAFKELRNDRDELVLFDILIHMHLFTCLDAHVNSLDLDLPEAEIIKLGKQIGTALKAAHKLGIMHRDIKPENIYINDEGDYLLGDLGVSKQLDDNSYSTLAGTPEYMAPEIWRATTNNRYNNTADIYSLGLVLYTFLNDGYIPFVDEHSNYEQMSQAVIKRLNGEPIPAPCYGSAAINKVILKACSVNPDERYQTAEEFITALEAIETGTASAENTVAVTDAVTDTTAPTKNSGESAVCENDTESGIVSQPQEELSEDNYPEQTVEQMFNIDTLLNKAQAQDADAQYKLAECYRYGIDTAKNSEEAIKWYKSAAELGNTEAEYKLGECYHTGEYVQQNHDEAFKLFTNAANKNHPGAQYYLGYCYYHAKGVLNNYVTAVMWYTKAAAQGNINAMYSLGYCYYEGKGVQRNYGEAARLFKEAAYKDNIVAMHMLGICHLHGYGVTQSDFEAVKWFEKAANKQYAPSMVELARCLYHGANNIYDKAEARNWVRNASSLGSREAKALLDEMNSTTNGAVYKQKKYINTSVLDKNSKKKATDIISVIEWIAVVAVPVIIFLGNFIMNYTCITERLILCYALMLAVICCEFARDSDNPISTLAIVIGIATLISSIVSGFINFGVAGGFILIGILAVVTIAALFISSFINIRTCKDK